VVVSLHTPKALFLVTEIKLLTNLKGGEFSQHDDIMTSIRSTRNSERNLDSANAVLDVRYTMKPLEAHKLTSETEDLHNVHNENMHTARPKSWETSRHRGVQITSQQPSSAT